MFKNPYISPCKYCITKPLCKHQCDDFEKYGILIHDTTYVIWMIFCLSVFIGFSCFLHLLFNAWLAYGIITIILGFGYFWAGLEIAGDIDGFREEFPNFWFRSFVMFISPLLVTGAWTWEKLEFLDKPLDNYIYKHIKKLQPKKDF